MNSFMKIFRLWWQIFYPFELEGVQMTILNRQTRLNANLITCIICILFFASVFLLWQCFLRYTKFQEMHKGCRIRPKMYYYKDIFNYTECWAYFVSFCIWADHWRGWSAYLQQVTIGAQEANWNIARFTSPLAAVRWRSYVEAQSR